MAQGFPTADIYSECHMETVECKVERCEMLISESLDYMQNPVHVNFCLQGQNSKDYLQNASNFFQEFSRQLSIFVLCNYLHDVVTPGVPDLPTFSAKLNFWLCVCTNKVIATKMYLKNDDYSSDPIFLDTLWIFLSDYNNKMKQLFLYPPS